MECMGKPINPASPLTRARFHCRIMGKVTLMRRMFRERLHQILRLMLRGLAQISSAHPGCSLPEGGGGGKVLFMGSRVCICGHNTRMNALGKKSWHVTFLHWH